jgi:hypothetical protein
MSGFSGQIMGALVRACVSVCYPCYLYLLCVVCCGVKWLVCEVPGGQCSSGRCYGSSEWCVGSLSPMIEGHCNFLNWNI